MLLSLLKPTLLATHYEFKTLKEMILFTPSQNGIETPLHPLASQLLQDFSYVSLKRYHPAYLLKDPYNITSTLSSKPFSPTN